jgi:peptide/nickel transport system permease protein
MSTAVTDDASGPQRRVLPRYKEMLINGIFELFFRDRRAVVGAILLVIMIFAAVAGPQLIPYDPQQPDLQDRFATPSWSHWMGTDRNGRDLFARVIAGASTSFKVAVGAALLAFVIGAPLGAVTSYVGGIVDDITQRFMDAIIAFPARLMAIVLIVLLGPSVMSLWFAIAFSSIP